MSEKRCISNKLRITVLYRFLPFRLKRHGKLRHLVYARVPLTDIGELVTFFIKLLVEFLYRKSVV